MTKLTICTLVVLFLIRCASAQQKEHEKIITAFVGAKIYPSPTDSAIEGGVILVQQGKIIAVGKAGKVKIPTGVRQIDCKGNVITAGFWNSHIHLTETQFENAAQLPADSLGKRLQRMLSLYGFVYAFDIGSFPENTAAIKKRISSGEILGPAIFTTGSPFVPQNGNPFYVAPVQLPQLTSSEQTKKEIAHHIQQGADGIKLFTGSPVAPDKVLFMPVAIAKQAAITAHQRNKPVFAHPTSNGGVDVVLQSGIDILAHTTPDGGEPWSPELAQKLVASNVCLIPTVKLWKWELYRKNIPGSYLQKFINLSVQQLKAFSSAGGKVLFGTDVGYMTDYNPSDEYDYMQKAQLSFRDILATLTTTPAQKFRQYHHTGKIVVGRDADLVILHEDPANNIRSFANVKAVYKKGIKIY